MKAHGLILAAMLTLVLSACRSEAERAEYKKLERDAFVVELPTWNKETDTGRAGLGRYKVVAKSKRAFAEVSWQGGVASSMEDMEAMAKAVSSGFDLEGAEQSRETVGDQLRVNMTASIKKKIWLAMTLVTCKQTGVMVTLGFGARKRKDALLMRRRAMDSFACRGNGPQAFAGVRFPAVALDESFGQHVDGEALLLVNRDGDVLYVVGGPASVFGEMRTRPDNVLRMFGKLLGFNLRLKGGSVQSQSGLAGAKQWFVSAVDIAGGREDAVIAGGFECNAIEQGFFVLAMSDDAKTPAADLAQLFAKLGCPNASTPPIKDRKTACEVGYQALCD